MALRPSVNSKKHFTDQTLSQEGLGFFLLIILSFNLLSFCSASKPHINKVMFSVATNIYNILQTEPTNYMQPLLLLFCTFVPRNLKHKAHRDPLDFFSKRRIFM